MLKRFHIDQLLLFFLLSISALVLAFGKSVIGFEKVDGTELVRYLAPQSMISFPDQGFIKSEDSVFAFNPEYDVFYSVDGGDCFFNGGSSFKLSDIENPNIIYIPGSYHWKRPIGTFPSGKNIVLYLKHKTRSIETETIYLTYFEKRESDLPVLSLTLNLEDLISEDQGLLVFGQESWSDEGFYKNWWNRNANFQRRGKQWERPAHVQYYEAGELKFEEDCGLKISGNATRGFPQKSFQLIARKTYGSEFLEYPFFGKSGNKKSRSLVIRNSGNDNTKTLFADLFMQTLARDSYVTTQTGHPLVVYINGNYWGIYNLRERIDPYYLSKQEDVKEEEITILEGLELKDGNQDEKEKFDDLIARLSTSVEFSDALMSEVQNEIDLNSFTDYIIFETYFANTDWPNNNSICFKSKEGKWKWILHDLDYGLAYLGESAVEKNLFEKLENSNSAVGILFGFLMKDQSYQELFVMRAEVVLNSMLSEKVITSVFENLSNQYRNEIGTQINRWRMIDSMEDWVSNCTKNLDFLINRRTFYLNQIEELDV
ncbi:MAG: CotH kinase family protein [Crocinitomicaceae bacterium]|nr:CotH kinase family protein [Crocinitomicaceae bacterium]